MAVIESFTAVTRDNRALTVRSPQPDDADALLKYIRAVAADAPYLLMEADEFDFPEEQERAWIEDHRSRPGWLVLMAEAAGEIVGTLSFESGLLRRTSHRGTLGVTVASAWRNQGIGTVLLETLLRWASDNPAIEKSVWKSWPTTLTRCVSTAV